MSFSGDFSFSLGCSLDFGSAAFGRVFVEFGTVGLLEVLLPAVFVTELAVVEGLLAALPPGDVLGLGAGLMGCLGLAAC